MSETMVSGDGNVKNTDEWKDFDFSAVETKKSHATRALPKNELIRFGIIGVLSGVLVWLLRLAFEAWVMNPLFCRTPDTASVCTNAGSTSFIVSLIAVGIIASSVLTGARVFRSILISAATFISLGALWPLLNSKSALAACVWSAFFAVVLYLFFAMIAAVKRYVLAIILIVALTIAFWLFVRA